MIKIFWLLLAFTALSPPAGARLKPGDFYCREIPNRPPDVIQTQVKSCGEGRPPEAQSVCIEFAQCAYVGDQFAEHWVTNERGNKVKYHRAGDKQRGEYLVKNLPPSAWLPSTLTCAKLSAPGSPICPALNDCSGDLALGYSAGAYTAEKDFEYRIRAPNPADSGAFRYKTGTPAK